MEDAPARLIITRGPESDQAYDLTLVETSLGRSAGNTIILAAPEISRRHAVIYFRGDRHFLEDLGSTNGTFVNGRRLTERVALADGDKVQFGDSYLMEYRSPTGPMQVIESPRVQVVTSTAPSAAGAMDEIPTPAPETQKDGEDQFIVPPETELAAQRMWIVACGCAPLVLASLCLASVFFLDSYQQGRLLYCGPLRPVFEVLLGSFGFNPVCITPF